MPFQLFLYTGNPNLIIAVPADTITPIDTRPWADKMHTLQLIFLFVSYINLYTVNLGAWKFGFECKLMLSFKMVSEISRNLMAVLVTIKNSLEPQC